MIRKTINEVKTKRFDFKLEQATVTKDASGKCMIEGYANTSSKDRVGDVVMPKAFEKTLETYMKNPVLLANHDWNDPCGVVTHAEITDKGLWIKAQISDTREDIKTLIREGCLRTFSIGYNEIDADYDEATKTKYIKELELLEISVVTVPANTEAMFTEIAAKTEPEAPAAKAEDGKSAPSARTAKDLKDFIETVKTVVDRDLDSKETVAVCDYFINVKEEETMTKEQLIAVLKAKSVEVAAAAPAPAPEAKADGPAAPADAAPQDMDMLKEVLAKLDAIAQGLAQLLEGPKPADAPSPEDAAPAAPKGEEQPEEGKEAEGSDDEKLSDEEIEKQLAEIELEILTLEDSEEA